MPKKQEQVELSKEIDEVMVCFVKIAQHLKGGGTLLTLPGAVAGELMTAISGCDQLDDEAREDLACALRTVGMRTGELTAALIAKKPEAAAPAQA